MAREKKFLKTGGGGGGASWKRIWKIVRISEKILPTPLTQFYPAMTGRSQHQPHNYEERFLQVR